MNAILLVQHIATFCLGMLVLLAILRQPCDWRHREMMWLAMAFPLGLSVEGVAFGLMETVGLPWGLWTVASEAILIGIGITLNRERLRRLVPRAHRGRRARTPSPVHLLFGLTILAVTCAVAAVVYGIHHSLPHGLWDAWTFWNHKSKIIAGYPDLWPNLLAQPALASHPDYPLLLPFSVGKLWRVTQGFEPIVPQSLNLLMAVSLILVTGFACCTVAGPISGSIGVMFLATMPLFYFWVPTQYADIWVGTGAVAGLGAFLASRESPRPLPPMVISGLMFGMAAFSKNEGLVAALTFLLAGSTCAGVRKLKAMRAPDAKLSIPVSQWLGWLAGFAIVAIVIALFKVKVGFQPELTVEQSRAAIFEQLTDPGRLSIILNDVYALLTHRDTMPWTASAVTMLVIGLVQRTIDQGKRFTPGIAEVWGLTLGFTAVILVGYMITRHELHWHVGTSAPRILGCQIVPMLTLGIACLLKPKPRVPA